jgi:hypothetical protein
VPDCRVQHPRRQSTCHKGNIHITSPAKLECMINTVPFLLTYSKANRIILAFETLKYTT